MTWHDDMRAVSAAVAGRGQQQPFGSAKPQMPTAMQDIHQYYQQLRAAEARGEMTSEQVREAMKQRLGPKNEETGYYSPTPSSGQIDLRPPYDPYEIRQTMKNQGWGLK